MQNATQAGTTIEQRQPGRLIIEDREPVDIMAEKRAKAARIAQGQQLFAKIKEDSKYFGQGDGGLFPVRVEAHRGDWCVQGGPGGQYWLSDVNLFVVDDGIEIKIS